MTIDKTKQYYLAGPMTGYPQFNIPLFERAASELRFDGFKVTSPVEMDSQPVRDAAMASEDGALDENDCIAGESWGEILARDVHVVADQIDGIIVLPNWWRSRGARLEVFVALLCKKPIYSYNVESRNVDQLPERLALMRIVDGFLR